MENIQLQFFILEMINMMNAAWHKIVQIGLGLGLTLLSCRKNGADCVSYVSNARLGARDQTCLVPNVFDIYRSRYSSHRGD